MIEMPQHVMIIWIKLTWYRDGHVTFPSVGDVVSTAMEPAYTVRVIPRMFLAWMVSIFAAPIE